MKVVYQGSETRLQVSVVYFLSDIKLSATDRPHAYMLCIHDPLLPGQLRQLSRDDLSVTFHTVDVIVKINFALTPSLSTAQM